jgi:hypothetical protein
MRQAHYFRPHLPPDRKHPGARCSVHSGGELSDEGRAIIATAAGPRHAKQARAVQRKELRRYPQGRKRKWAIPTPWRFALTKAEAAKYTPEFTVA